MNNCKIHKVFQWINCNANVNNSIVENSWINIVFKYFIEYPVIVLNWVIISNLVLHNVSTVLIKTGNVFFLNNYTSPVQNSSLILEYVKIDNLKETSLINSENFVLEKLLLSNIDISNITQCSEAFIQ